MQREDIKESKYNLYFPSLKKELYIVYNTLTEGTVLVSEDGIEAIRTSPSKIPEQKRQELINAGILVSANTDERRIFRVNHNRIKYSTEECFVLLYTTYRCNMACTYCYEDFLSKTKDLNQDMSLETADVVGKFIKNIASKHGFREIRLFFFGGEPLLNPDPILSLLNTLSPWAQSKGVHFTNAICTNGTVPLEELLPRLLHFNTFFHFTIDGPKAVHDERRPYLSGSGTFDDIMKNISLVSKVRANFGIRVNVDKRNAAKVETLLRQLRTELGESPIIRFAEVIPPIGGTEKPTPCPWASQCFMGKDPKMIVSLIKYARDLGLTVVTRPMRDWVFCECLRDHSYLIDPFGDIYKCEGLAGIKDHRAGALRDDGTIEANYTMDNWLSHDPLETDCRDCVYLPICGGGCPCLTFEETGTYHVGGCTMFKHLYHEFIKYHLESKYPWFSNLLSTELINIHKNNSVVVE